MHVNEEFISNIVKHELGAELGMELGEGGSFGVCFELTTDPNSVVKVTSSMSEAIYALRLVGEEHDNVVDIHRVIQVDKDFGNKPMFLIHQERVTQEHELMSVVEGALSALDNGFLDIYHPFDWDDYNDEVREVLESNPNYVEAIHQIQDAMWHHESIGNLAMDIKLNNMGVKSVDGTPIIAIFDQMNLKLEYHLTKQLAKSPTERFSMGDHVVESKLSSLVITKEHAVLARMEQEMAVLNDFEDETITLNQSETQGFGPNLISDQSNSFFPGTRK